MVEIKKTLIGTLMVALILLSSGTTYYIKESEGKTGCRDGWMIEETGDFEGQFSCTTQTGKRYETCYEVYASANTENYWCKKGVLVEKTVIKETLYTSNKGSWVCPPNNVGCMPI